MNDDVKIVVLRALVESYHAFLISPSGFSTFRAFAAGVTITGNAEASCLRAILAIDPDVAHEIRRLGSVLPANNHSEWNALLCRLGIDIRRDDSEFDVVPSPPEED